MDDLDKNRDGDVNFREFSQYVACLAKGYYKKKHGDDKDKPRRNKWTLFTTLMPLKQ